MPEVVAVYHDAWNRHDADALVATFVEGGTYQDPNTAGPLSGAAIAEEAKGLWEAFPDVTFTLGECFGRSDRIAVQWLMTGTNTSAFHGLPPTGRKVNVPGADFFELSGDKIVSVHGYFDSRTVPDHLGLQVVIQPHTAGPFTFGTSARAYSGSKAKPGAFSITLLESNDAEDSQQIRQEAVQMALEMQRMPGMISMMGVTNGNRRLTITAWEHPEDMDALTKSSTQESAMAQAFRKHGLSQAVHVSSWVPVHQGAMWLRCGECGTMVDSNKVQVCSDCGARLREPAAYW